MTARPTAFSEDGPIDEAMINGLIKTLPGDHEALANLEAQDLRNIVEGLARNLATAKTETGSKWIEDPKFDSQVISNVVASFHGSTSGLSDAISVTALEHVAASMLGTVVRKVCGIDDWT